MRLDALSGQQAKKKSTKHEKNEKKGMERSGVRDANHTSEYDYANEWRNSHEADGKNKIVLHIRCSLEVGVFGKPTMKYAKR